MSDLSSLPPSGVIRAASLAVTADIAVRLINLPDSLQNTSQPVRLTGTVQGGSPEGIIRVETDRGVVDILLKDRGSLPAGQKIDIDIPAGRPPQQAAIRPSPPVASPPPISSPPPLSSYLDPNRAPPVRLDRTQNMRADDLATALSAAGDTEEIPRAFPLQPGQILRLVPISSMPQTLQNIQNAASFTPEEALINLINFLSQAPDLPAETRDNMINLLSRAAPPLTVDSLGENAPAPVVKQLENLLQKIAQPTEVSENSSLQNAAFQKTTTVIFNAARPLDIEVLAFQKSTFQTTLQQVAQGATASQAAPVLTRENFVVGTIVQPTLPTAYKVPAGSTDLPPDFDTPSAAPTTASIPTSATTPETQVGGKAAPIPLQPLPQSAPPNPATPNPAPPNPAPPQSVIPPAGNPAPPSVAPAPAPPQPVLVGQVTGMTVSGQPVITLSLPGVTGGAVYVAQIHPDNIAPGASLFVSPLPVATQPARSAPGFVPFGIGTNQPLPEWAIPDMWEPLQSLMAAATHIDPALASASARMVPAAGGVPQNMAPLALFMLSVMRTGDIDTWVGEPVLAVLKQAGKIDILRAVAGEVTNAHRFETAQMANEWRGVMLPFWQNGQVHKLPLYFKQWDDGDDGNDARERRKKLRFLFELKLSRMGAVQVDGFMQDKKLDMILRTKAAISVSMQEAVRATYTRAIGNSNLTGEISFQFKPENWMKINIASENYA